MSFLMLLQIPLKFWQLCKISLAIISGTPQFFIRCVNNTGGRWNCLWWPTLRLTGHQAWCVPILTSLMPSSWMASSAMVMFSRAWGWDWGRLLCFSFLFCSTSTSATNLQPATDEECRTVTSDVSADILRNVNNGPRKIERHSGIVQMGSSMTILKWNESLYHKGSHVYTLLGWVAAAVKSEDIIVSTIQHFPPLTQTRKM